MTERNAVAISTVSLLLICLVACTLTANGQRTLSADTGGWPQWRGPGMTGTALRSDPPTEWSETKNIKWKAEIPGKGHASPVVWKDTVFVLTAVATDKPDGPSEVKGS